MRNHSSARSSLRRVMLLWVAGAAFLAFCTTESHAQCSADDDPDSFGCQLQQAAPPSSSRQSQSAPTVPTMQEQAAQGDRKSTRLNSSHANISYAVFCLKKK